MAAKSASSQVSPFRTKTQSDSHLLKALLTAPPVNSGASSGLYSTAMPRYAGPKKPSICSRR